jgi:hypothetical protein
MRDPFLIEPGVSIRLRGETGLVITRRAVEKGTVHFER